MNCECTRTNKVRSHTETQLRQKGVNLCAVYTVEASCAMGCTLTLLVLHVPPASTDPQLCHNKPPCSILGILNTYVRSIVVHLSIDSSQIETSRADYNIYSIDACL